MFYGKSNHDIRLLETSFLGCRFDFERHKVHLIHKVLEYGLLKEMHGLETIKKVSLNLRALDAVSLSYLSAIFNIDKTEFRCYKHKQLVPNNWNS